MASSIQEMFNNIKQLLADDSFFFAILIVLVALSSFGLGRWSTGSVVPQKSEILPVVTEQASKVQNAALLPVISTTTKTSEVATTAVASVKKYVASRSGKKYHLLWCAGAKTIKEANKIYFGSKEEAQKAGYSPAANCKGI